jgi:hypothetical protein
MHIAFVCVVPRSVRHGGCPSCGGCAGRSREARAARALCPAERPCSHSAHLGKKVKDETTTHRGRTRSNEPIIEGSRYKKVEARRYKVKPRRAPPRTPDQTGRKRRTPPLGPRPAATERYHDPLSVAELRYEILNTGESRSTRGTLLGRPTATPRCSVLVASSRCVRTGHDHTDTQSRWCGGVVVFSRYFYLCVAHVAACVIEIMSMRICVSEL